MTAENSNYINLFNDNNQEDDLTYFEQTDIFYFDDFYKNLKFRIIKLVQNGVKLF